MKSILRNTLAACVLAIPAVAMAQGVEPEPLPDAVRAVEPAQGYINTFINEFPLGAANIAINFGGEVEVNRESTSTISIYVDGSETPAETLKADDTNVAVDAMTGRMAGFTFRGIYNVPGTYHITIGEGIWLYGDSKTPSPAFSLNYAVRKDYTVNPAPNSELDEIEKIEFILPDGATDIQTKSSSFKLDSSSFEAISVTVTATENSVIVVPDKTVTAPGMYKLTVDPAAITYTLNGEEIEVNGGQYSYTVTDSSAKDWVFDPENGSTISELYDIKVTAPEAFVESHDFILFDTMGHFVIYKDGAVFCKVKGAPGAFGNPFTFRVLNGNSYAEAPLKLEEGTYVLQLVTGWCTDAPAMNVTWYVKSGVGVEAVETAEALTVYTTSGILLGENMDKAAFEALPAGLYIVNGKKIAK